MKHCVYKHTFPDGKVYIGQTSSGGAEQRWQNGWGYSGQGKIWPAIVKYGWVNIKHEIIDDGIDDEDIDNAEAFYIEWYNSKTNGYNSNYGKGKYKRDVFGLDKWEKTLLLILNRKGFWCLDRMLKAEGIQDIERGRLYAADYLKQITRMVRDEFDTNLLNLVRYYEGNGVDCSIIISICYLFMVEMTKLHLETGGYQWRFVNDRKEIERITVHALYRAHEIMKEKVTA